MKKEVITHYDENDFYLLSKYQIKKLPVYPCSKCSSNINGGCCGCDKETAYRQAWKPYETAGIVDIAKNILRKQEIEEQIIKLQDELDSVRLDIPNVFLED